MMEVDNVNYSFLTYLKGVTVFIIVIGGILHTTTSEDIICTEPICYDFVNFLKKGLNRTADACEDLYNHACGLYSNSEETTILTLHEIMEKRMESFTASFFDGSVPLHDYENLYRVTQNIYSNCVNNASGSIDTLKYLQTIFCWWGVDETCKKSQNDIRQFFQNVRNYGYFGNDFFSLYVQKDKTNSSRQILYIDRPGKQGNQFGPPFPQFTLHTVRFALTESFLYKFTLTLGGKAARISSIINEIVEFHQKVLDAWHHYIQQDNHHILKVKDLKSAIDNKLTWKTLINTIIDPASLNDDDEIAVTCVACLQEIGLIFTQDPEGAVQYGIVNLLLDASQYAYKELRGQLSQSPEEFCRCNMAGWFFYAFDSAYQETRIQDIKKHNELIMNMFKTMKNILWKMVFENIYLEDKSREYGVLKVTGLRLFYGFPENLEYFTAYTKIIKEAGVHYRSDLLSAKLNITKYFLSDMFEHLNASKHLPHTIKKYFSGSSLDVHFDYQENAVILPAAAIHEFYAHEKLPIETNYALIGTIIAHEMAHIFDNEGRKYDGSGNIFETVPINATKILDETNQCYQKWYSKFVNPDTKRRVDGQKTMEENMADTVGAFVATYSISKEPQSIILPDFNDYPKERYFWLSYASRFCYKYTRDAAAILETTSTHAPNYFRVNGVASGIIDFSRFFRCQPNVTMNPGKICNFLYFVHRS